MHAQSAALVLGIACAGLIVLMMFAQTTKHLQVNATATFLSLLALPMGIALLWRIGSLVGWWAALVFVLASIAGGMCNAVLARQRGREPLYALQPWLGATALAATLAAWIV